LPLDEAKTDLSDKIISYSEEVERLRREEEARIDAINTKIERHFYRQLETIEDVDIKGKELKEYFDSLSEADKSIPSIKVAFMTTIGYLSDKKSQIQELARAEAERIRQAEEQKRLDAEAEKQSVEENRLAAERKANEDAKRQIEEDKLQIERDKAEIERQKELQKAEAEAFKLEKERAKQAKAAPKTNQVTRTNFDIIDADKVDRIYCSPDEKIIREAIKAGIKEIAGIYIYEETKVR
jgi:chromosome segregation ATPase